MKTLFIKSLTCAFLLYAVACKKSDNNTTSNFNISGCKITVLGNRQSTTAPAENTFIYNSNGAIVKNNSYYGEYFTYEYGANKVTIKVSDNYEQHDYYIGSNGFAKMQAVRSHTDQNYDTTLYSYDQNGYLLTAITKYYERSYSDPNHAVVYDNADTSYYVYAGGNLMAILRGYKRDTSFVYSYYTKMLNNNFLLSTVDDYPVEMMGANALLGKPNKNLVKTSGRGGTGKPNGYNYVLNAYGQVTQWQIFPSDEDFVFLNVAYNCK